MFQVDKVGIGYMFGGSGERLQVWLGVAGVRLGVTRFY